MKTSTSDFYSNMGGITKDFSMVRKTSYKKLVKKKHEMQKENGGILTNEKTEKAILSKIKSSSDALANSLHGLTSKGKGSVFGAGGELDKDRVEKEVNSFVKNYNSLIKESVKTDHATVLRSTLNLVEVTKSYKNQLEKIGINLNSDNTLSVDTEKLKKAKDSDIKAVFQGAHSYGAKVKRNAAKIANASMVSFCYQSTGAYGKQESSSFSGYY